MTTCLGKSCSFGLPRVSVYVFSYFPFGFEGRMLNLIVSLLIFSLRTAALYSKCQPAKYLTV